MGMETMKEAFKNSTQNEYIGRLSSLLVGYIATPQKDLNTSRELDLEDLRGVLLNLSGDHLSRIVNDVTSLADNRLEESESDEQIEYKFDEILVDHFDYFQLIVNGYVTIAIASVGLVSNILGICFVRTGSRRGKLFNKLLAAIFVFDTVFLSLEILRWTEAFFLPVPKRYLRMLLIVVHTGIRFSMTSSILSLVAIARARLVAIRKPFQNLPRTTSLNETRSSTNEVRKRFLKYIIPIVITSILSAAPVYWEFDEEAIQMKHDNSTLVPSSLRLSPIYSTFYVGFLNFGLLGVFPLTSLVYSSYHLINESKKQNERLRTLNNQMLANRDKQHTHLTKSLVFIIFAFIALHSLRIFNWLGELIILLMPNKNENGLKTGSDIPILFYFTSSISELFLITYASINVMIYLYTNLSKWTRSFSQQATPNPTELAPRRNAIIEENPNETNHAILALANNATFENNLNDISNESLFTIDHHDLRNVNI